MHIRALKEKVLNYSDDIHNVASYMHSIGQHRSFQNKSVCRSIFLLTPDWNQGIHIHLGEGIRWLWLRLKHKAQEHSAQVNGMYWSQSHCFKKQLTAVVIINKRKLIDQYPPFVVYLQITLNPKNYSRALAKKQICMQLVEQVKKEKWHCRNCYKNCSTRNPIKSNSARDSVFLPPCSSLLSHTFAASCKNLLTMKRIQR